MYNRIPSLFPCRSHGDVGISRPQLPFMLQILQHLLPNLLERGYLSGMNRIDPYEMRTTAAAA